MDTNNFAFFAGYQTIRQWLAAVDKQRPVFACMVVEPGPTAATGVRIDRLVVIAAQPDPDQAMVHYFRMPATSLRFVFNDPFDPDHDERKRAADGLWRIIETWLEEQGLEIRNGVIATPTNLRLLDGIADFVGFDNTKREYYRVDTPKSDNSPLVL